MPLVCALNDAVCIRVSGADAGEFLRAQLARDPPPLVGAAEADAATHVQTDADGAQAEADRSVLAAWLDARGRVRALFRVVALEQDYVLLAERETAAAVLAKLRMFVLRARVALSLDEDWQAAAVLGRAEDTTRAGSATRATLHWMRIGPELAYAIGPRQHIADLIARASPADTHAIDLAEIRLGLPKLGAALTERYVPQMLNLDLLGAVAFDKGCYPGQEVVARLKYRGSVKRRLQRFAWKAPTGSGSEGPLPAAGDEIVDRNGETVGEVVRAARAADGGASAADGAASAADDGASADGGELLAVVQLESVAAGLRLAADRDRHAAQRDRLGAEGGHGGVESGHGEAERDGAATDGEGLTLEPLPLPYEAAGAATPQP